MTAKAISSPSISQISHEPEYSDPSAAHHLVYFITGNPGLISYYNTFLATLHGLLLDKTSASNVCHIYGQSLAGFEDTTVSTDTRTTPYSLEEQISLILTAIEYRNSVYKTYETITLIGHSVGSYILLEVIQRLRKSSSPLNVTAGILLFPTVTHIAKSPNGVKLAALARLPDFPRRASQVAKVLVSLAPETILKWLVGVVTRMPHDAAAVTTRFLKSRMGIWQALHLGKDEMETITDDKWDEDIWGIEHEDPNQKSAIPKLIFYFGEHDQWVANHTRDALIATRGGNSGETLASNPVMVIDRSGIPHGFCIRHSEIMAEKVKVWIEDIISKSSASR